MNTYGYALQNPLNLFDPLGLAICPPQHSKRPLKNYESDYPRIYDCVYDGNSRPPNSVSGFASVFPETANALDECSICRADCFGDFVNPFPGVAVEKGAKAAGESYSKQVGRIAEQVARKTNKAVGVYDLTRCLKRCQMICDDENCKF